MSDKEKIRKFVQRRADINRSGIELELGIPTSAFKKWINGSRETFPDKYIPALLKLLIEKHCYHCKSSKK